MENKFIIRWIVFFLIYGFVDFYYFQMIRTICKKQWFYVVLEVISFAVLLFYIFQYSYYRERTINISAFQNYSVGLLFGFMIFKLIILVFLFTEDIARGFVWLYRLLTTRRITNIEGRRQFVSRVALVVASIPLAGLLYGVFVGRYSFRVVKHTLFFEDLPDDFEGYQITHISDLHSGSFDDHDKVSYMIDLINQQQSDVILFTGDIVNNRTEELLPWKDLYAKLDAKDGVYSILGNHDYGDYERWHSEQEKTKNMQDLLRTQKEIGFDLLRNEHRYIHKGASKIALVGVENWGTGRFKKAGDLGKAKREISSDDFKILMSHDPSHWQYKVLSDKDHFHLTLSGHTHGMQFGIEIPGWIKWSPSQWKYKYWAGVYKEQGQYINVNRGLGYLGYPGRLGVWPEVSVIELRKKTKS